ncbi:MAG: ribonuclease P protein component [Nannocystaceae bacterium]|nr:ribonuclease P protein component [Nannocystaceae bacterium]
MKPQGLPRWLRLRQRREFLRVQRRGQKHHTRHFLVFVAPRSGKDRWRPTTESAGVLRAEPAEVSGHPGREVTPQSEAPALRPTRLGVTVTRKVGRAHQRNRIKRLAREVFRQERALLPPGYDMVLVAKRNALGFTLEELRTDFVALARRLTRLELERDSS